MNHNMPTGRRPAAAPPERQGENRQNYIRPTAKKGSAPSSGALVLLAVVLVISLVVLVGMFAALNYRNNMIADLESEYAFISEQNESLKAEISRRRCKRNSVLTCSGFRDKLLFTHVFCKKSLSHTVIKLVRTRVVEVLAL